MAGPAAAAVLASPAYDVPARGRLQMAAALPRARGEVAAPREVSMAPMVAGSCVFSTPESAVRKLRRVLGA